MRAISNAVLRIATSVAVVIAIVAVYSDAVEVNATTAVLTALIVVSVVSAAWGLHQLSERARVEALNAEQRRTEEALRAQANLLNLVHDAIFVRDLNSVIKYWNRGAEELYGWTAQEAAGQVSHSLLNRMAHNRVVCISSP